MNRPARTASRLPSLPHKNRSPTLWGRRMARCLSARTVILARFALLAALVLSAPAHSADFCVTDSTELQAALTTAQANGEDDTVRITTGVHATPAGGLVYDAPASEEFALTLVGGFSSPWSNPCSEHQDNPFKTVLDGGHAGRVMVIAMPGNSDVQIRSLTFANGTAPVDRVGGGLAIGATDYSGSVFVDRSAFVGNEAYSGGGMYLHQAAGSNARVTIRNSLFLYNKAVTGSGGALVLDHQAAAVIDPAAFLVNNTVLGNTAASGTGGVHLIGPELDATVANNNLWGNRDLAADAVADLQMDGGPLARLDLLHNNFGVRGGFPPDVDLNNISVEPQYEPLGWQFIEFNFIPARNSPLVDAGAMPAPKMPPWNLAPTDLFGNARVVGTLVDIGAYENERIFFANFDGPLPVAIGD